MNKSCKGDKVNFPCTLKSPRPESSTVLSTRAVRMVLAFLIDTIFHDGYYNDH
jgi:hypothetical protein